MKDGERVEKREHLLEITRLRERSLSFSESSVCNEPEDALLVREIIGGNREAVVHLLIDRCGPRLKYLSELKFRTLGMTFCDLVSEIFLVLQCDDWKALRGYRGECRLESYISTIAARFLWKKMDAVVKENNRFQPLYDEMGRELFPAVDDSVEKAKMASELLEYVSLMDNPRERLVIQLYKLEGYSAQEVANLLQTTPGNVYTLCNRAMASLRIMMQEGGVYA